MAAQASKSVRLGDLLRISRPLAWVNTLVPFTAGYLLGFTHLTLPWLIGALFFTLPYNLFLYGVNDIYDVESDHRNPRKDSAEGANIGRGRHTRLAWLIALVLLPGGIYLWWLSPLTARVLLGAMLVLGLAYSVRPLRFKEIPLLDSLTSSAHFVLPLVFGLALAGSTRWYWPAVSAFFIWGVASHALGAIQDIGPDRAAHQRSLATFLGARKTSLLSFWCYLICCLIVAIAYYPLGLLAAVLLAFYPLNVSFFFKYKSDAKHYLYHRAWRNFLALNYIIGFWLVQLLLFFADPMRLGAQHSIWLADFFIGFAIFQILLIIHNLAGFRRPKNRRLSDYPKASILIHAYNQADNIASTMLAALGQNYPDYEIIFADLGSVDNTANIVASYQDERLKTVRIDPLPADWTINSWASQQLLTHATGSVVVLLSADTVLLPDTLGVLVSLMAEQKLDFISLLPADQNKTLAQKMLLSLNRFFWIGLYPAAYLTKNFPQFSAAYSGLMAFSRTSLETIGGFVRVKRSPLEDLDLFAAAKAEGLKTGFYFGSELAVMQNHASFRLIVLQNLQRYYPALRFNFGLCVAVVTGGLFVLCLPAVLLLYALAAGRHELALLLAIGIGMAVINRLVVAITSRQSYGANILYPATSLVALVLILFSMLNYELFRPRWQKRTEL